MKEYYRPKEAIKILGITAPSYRYLLTTNYFKSIKKIKNASWVSKKEINEYKNFLVDLNKNYISVEEIAKKLGMRKKLILKRLKKFSGNKIKHKNTYWIKKEFISREFEEIVNDPKEIFDKKTFEKNYYDSNKAAKLLGISRSHLIYHYNEEFICDHRIIYQNNYWYPKDKVDSIINFLKEHTNIRQSAIFLGLRSHNILKLRDLGLLKISDIFLSQIWIPNDDLCKCKKILKKYITKNEALKILGINYAALKWQINKKKTIKTLRLLKTPLVLREDVLKLKNEQKNIIDDEDYYSNPIKVYNYFTKNYDFEKMMDTQKLHEKFFLKNYFKAKHVNFESRKIYIRKFCHLINTLSELLDKELYLYNDEELINLLLVNRFIKSRLVDLNKFINFCKILRSDKCKLLSKISYVNRVPNKIVIKGYTEEEWQTAIIHLSDIDFHLPKAVKNNKYAILWLWQIFLLFLTWRGTDIYKFPLSDHRLVRGKNFQFFIKYRLSLFESQKIIDKCEYMIKKMRSNKTNSMLEFIVPEPLKQSFATAYLCALFHSKVKKQGSLFESVGKLPPNKYLYNYLSFNDTSNKFVPLTIRNAVKTLMTSTFEKAANDPKYSACALQLASKLRGHKVDGISMGSDVTAEYFLFNKPKTSYDALTYNFFKRGSFGFSYYILIDSIFDLKTFPSITDITNTIYNFKHIFEPITLEIFSKFFLRYYTQKTSLIEFLSQRPKNERSKIFKDLMLGRMPSKTNKLDCILCKECKYPDRVNCISCNYSIPQIYILKGINKRLEELIKRIKSLKINDVMERTKISVKIFNTLSLIIEAQEFYEKFDKNYIQAFININNIKRDIDLLIENNCFIFLE